MKKAPSAPFSFAVIIAQGRAAMAFARQRRHQQLSASPMGRAGSWLHQHWSMVAPADTAQKAGSPQPGQRWVLVEPSSCAITASWASLAMADQ